MHVFNPLQLDDAAQIFPKMTFIKRPKYVLDKFSRKFTGCSRKKMCFYPHCPHLLQPIPRLVDARPLASEGRQNIK